MSRFHFFGIDLMYFFRYWRRPNFIRVIRDDLLLRINGDDSLLYIRFFHNCLVEMRQQLDRLFCIRRAKINKSNDFRDVFQRDVRREKLIGAFLRVSDSHDDYACDQCQNIVF